MLAAHIHQLAIKTLRRRPEDFRHVEERGHRQRNRSCRAEQWGRRAGRDGPGRGEGGQAARPPLGQAPRPRVQRLAARVLDTQGNGQKGSPKFVDHERIRGTVGDVTPESITVVSLDGFKETFAITKATQFTAPVVKEKQPVKKGVAGANVGDQVLVVGTGPEKLTADLITDAGPAPKGAELG